MEEEKLSHGLRVMAQTPLDGKTSVKTLLELTDFGQDNENIFALHEGILVYCVETDATYKWLDVSKISAKNDAYVKYGPSIKYPNNVVANGIVYSNRTFSYFRVVALDSDTVNKMIGKGLENVQQDMDDFKIATEEYLELQKQLSEKYITESLTESEAKQLLELENARREMEARLRESSELLAESVDSLKDSMTDVNEAMQNSIDNLQKEINNLPTNVVLTNLQLDTLRIMMGNINDKFLDVEFKINTLKKDEFLPEDQIPILDALSLRNRQEHQKTKHLLDEAIKDAVLTEEERDALNAQLDEYRKVTAEIGDKLLEIYDLINLNMGNFFNEKLEEAIKEVKYITEYSKDGTGNWHFPYKEGDFYMRQKNGENGDWSLPIRIKGEEGLSTFKATAFIRSSSVPAVPTGGTWANPKPTTAGWSNSIPAGELPTYMSTRVFTHSGIAPQEAVWSKPELIGDTPDIDYEFSDLLDNPGNPTTHPANWYDGGKESSVWMAVRRKSLGKWGNWDISKIKGRDGKYKDYQFAVNKDLYNPPTTGWEDTPPTSIKEDEYLWQRSGDVIPPKTTPDFWVSVRITGPAGKDGINGKDAVVIDLTNESSSVPATSEGKVEGAIPSTQAIVYEGNKIATGWKFKVALGKAVGSINENTGVLTVTSVVDDISILTITATKSSYTDLKAEYTITKVKAGKPGEHATVYYLELSDTAIKVDKNSVVTPAKLTATAYSVTGNEAPKVEPSIVIKYKEDAGVEKVYTAPITPLGTVGKYTFSIYDKNGKVLDTETVPVIRDGKDGTNGKDGLNGLQGKDGTNGIDGKTSYTHLAYADDANGKNLSFTDSNKPYIGIYYDFVQANSTDPKKYAWSKWQGADGNNGVPGVSVFKSTVFTRNNGTVAVPTGGSYTSPLPTTAGWSDGVPTGEAKLYMSTRVFTNTGGAPQQGAWTTPQAISNSVDIEYKFSKVVTNPGDPTANASNWTNTSDANSIWMAVRKQTNGTWSTWDISKIKGETGTDGKTTYFHRAWANSADGKTGFSTSDSANKTYMGTYTDFTAADSTDPTKYKWSLIKGNDGSNGIDGKTSYTHIAYADTATGGGFSQNPTGKAYIGMYVDFIQQDSTDPTKYKWSLVKGIDGKDGVPGKAGADGKTPYFHTAWANSQDGKTGFSTTVSTDKDFIGTYTDFTQADSTDPTKYKWSRIREKVIISNTQPTTNLYIGLRWINTSKSPIEEYYWNGNTWILIGLSASYVAAEIKKANDALKKTMDDALKDGIITNNEALAISRNISTLESDKRTLDIRYNQIYKDPKLGASSKATLLSNKTDFDLKHKALVDICNTISKQSSVSQAQVNDYKAKQAAYDTSLTKYSTSLEQCQDEILKNSIDDIKTGGRNYLLKSNVKVTNANYAMKTYSIAGGKSSFKNGDECIITIWGTLGSDRNSFRLYNTSGDFALATLSKISEGIYSAKFKWAHDKSNNDSVVIYQFNNTNTSASTINLIKLEKGNVRGDWSIAPEDQQEQIDLALLNAANAKAIAEASRDKINFLTVSTDPKIGLITGSTLIVGDAKGANAFISGVSDAANNKSIRIGAGVGGYANKNSLPFRVLEDGTLYASNAIISGEINARVGTIGGFKIENSKIVAINNLFDLDASKGITFRDKDKKVRMEIKLDTDGTPAIIFYDSQGNITWKAGTTGIIYENFIAESYNAESFYGPLSGTPNASVVDSYMKSLRKQQTYYWSSTENQGTGTEFLFGISGFGGGNTYYSYNAGKNPESENNKKYEGYLYSTQNKLGAKIANGWYVINSSFSHEYGQRLEMTGPGNTEIVQIPSNVNQPFYCARIVDGKIVERKSYKALLQMSSPGGGNNGLVKEIPYSNVKF